MPAHTSGPYEPNPRASRLRSILRQAEHQITYKLKSASACAPRSCTPRHDPGLHSDPAARVEAGGQRDVPGSSPDLSTASTCALRETGAATKTRCLHNPRLDQRASWSSIQPRTSKRHICYGRSPLRASSSATCARWVSQLLAKRTHHVRSHGAMACPIALAVDPQGDHRQDLVFIASHSP